MILYRYLLTLHLIVLVVGEFENGCPKKKLLPHRASGRTFGAFYQLLPQNRPPSSLQEEPDQDDECDPIDDYDETDIGSLTRPQQQTRFFWALLNRRHSQPVMSTISTSTVKPRPLNDPTTTFPFQPQVSLPSFFYPGTGGYFGFFPFAQNTDHQRPDASSSSYISNHRPRPQRRPPTDNYVASNTNGPSTDSNTQGAGRPASHSNENSPSYQSGSADGVFSHVNSFIPGRPINSNYNNPENQVNKNCRYAADFNGRIIQKKCGNTNVGSSITYDYLITDNKESIGANSAGNIMSSVKPSKPYNSNRTSENQGNNNCRYEVVVSSKGKMIKQNCSSKGSSNKPEAQEQTYSETGSNNRSPKPRKHNNGGLFGSFVDLLLK